MNIHETLQISHREALQTYIKSKVVEYVEVLPAADSCPNCKQWLGKKIKLDEAIKKTIIPIHNCTHSKGYCRCTYIPVI